MSYDDAIRVVREYVAERGWDRFHTPENLAKSISIEAGELLEEFQWNGSFDTEEVANELADVLTYAYLLADKLQRDPNQLVIDKAELTRQKYPKFKAYGRSEKHDRL